MAAAGITLTAPNTRTATTGMGTITGTDGNLSTVTVPTDFGGVTCQALTADGRLQCQGGVQGDAPNAAAFTIVAGSAPFEVQASDCAPPQDGFWQFAVAGNGTAWRFQGSSRRATGHA